MRAVLSQLGKLGVQLRVRVPLVRTARGPSKIAERSDPRSVGPGDSTLLRIGGSGVPWVFPSPAENNSVEAPRINYLTLRPVSALLPHSPELIVKVPVGRSLPAVTQRYTVFTPLPALRMP